MKITTALALTILTTTAYAAQSPQAITNELFTLLQSGQNRDYIGEPISQLEHALQCADRAVQAGSDDQTILAALFHDIGHLCAGSDAEKMQEYGVAEHEFVGAQYLKKCGFSDKVLELIKGHVEGKRYLIFSDPKYYAQLSEASKQTLIMQGGSMTPEQAAAFEKDPLFKEKIQMRRWDEQAKVIGLVVPGLEAYKDMCIRHLSKEGNAVN